MNTKPKLTEADLAQFTGTENYYFNPLFGRRNKYSDGVKYVAEVAGAYWLLDIVLSHQIDPKACAEEFQVWTLAKIHGTDGCTVTMTDGNSETPIIQQKVEFTDFPLDNFKMWRANEVLYLPSEH
jgi:hypothetical protein